MKVRRDVEQNVMYYYTSRRPGPQWCTMGYYRNKARKQEEDARIRAMQARMEGSKSEDKRPRCQCGLTADQVPIMWAHQADRWSAVQFYCPACLPEQFNHDVRTT